MVWQLEQEFVLNNIINEESILHISENVVLNNCKKVCCMWVSKCEKRAK